MFTNCETFLTQCGGSIVAPGQVSDYHKRTIDHYQKWVDVYHSVFIIIRAGSVFIAEVDYLPQVIQPLALTSSSLSQGLIDTTRLHHYQRHFEHDQIIDHHQKRLMALFSLHQSRTIAIILGQV